MKGCEYLYVFISTFIYFCIYLYLSHFSFSIDEHPSFKNVKNPATQTFEW